MNYSDDQFPDDRVLAMSSQDQRLLVATLQRAGIAAGAVYDAVVALTAHALGATLLTLDGRALPTYERLKISVSLLTAVGRSGAT